MRAAGQHRWTPSGNNCRTLAGESAKGLYMDTQEQVEVKTLSDIPLGHKIAMIDHQVDDSVIKYGADIGKVVADIKKGGHVHTQNLKTRRW